MKNALLLIDDQEIDRVALRQILAAEPTWEIQEATGGQEALDLLCGGLRPRVCLADLRMPGMDGMELLRRIRRDRDLRGLKVVITSASRDRTMIVELAKLGIDGYLLKPYDAGKALATLRPMMAPLDGDEPPAVLRDLLTRTAFIVDDDPVARAALGALIKTEPHWAVVEAHDGADALEQLRAGPPPHLCFLDLNMPGLDGITLLEEIRHDPKLSALHVAVTSAERSREKILALAQLRIDAYLLKPLDATKVRAALRAAA